MSMDAPDVDLILFDWGGTLARVARQEEAWAQGAVRATEALAEAGFRHPSAREKLVEVILRTEGHARTDPEHREVRVDDVFRAWTAACGWEPPGPAVRDAAVEAFGRSWVGCLDPYPGAAEALAELRRRGYRLGLASNCWTPPPYCHEELDRHGFRPLLHAVTISCEVGYRKPSPVFYAAAMRNAASNGKTTPADRTLFVGDSPIYDVEGPAKAGMVTTLVRNERAAWPADHYEHITADLEIESVRQLLDVLPARNK
jgi:FMN phosphatase YigB (HAD superfamily)